MAAWVRLKHAGQMIKMTGDPYFNHLMAVAQMAAPAASMGYEIGLCHDLLEKTPTTTGDFGATLLNLGYCADETTFIVSHVIELTDVFTKAAYPHLAKSARKDQEAMRLSGISSGAQTVKYADLIDNINWVIKYDSTNSVYYLKKKRSLLISMNAGDAGLRNQAMALVNGYFRMT